MTQKGRLLQDLARSTLLQALHPLSKRPESALQLRAHGALGEAEVLGDLLGVCQQLALEREVFGFGGAALARAGERPGGDGAAFEPHQDFR